MKNFTSKGRRSVAGGMVVLALMLSLVLSAPAAQAGPCEEAFFNCLADAAVTMMSNPVSGLLYMIFCLDGYDFCLTYIQR